VASELDTRLIRARGHGRHTRPEAEAVLLSDMTRHALPIGEQRDRYPRSAFAQGYA
jgi:hypothetical protein